MKRVGILGGTFDPPHLGHLMMAEEARIRAGLDEVWWIPNYTPPHKQLSSQTTEEQRIELVSMTVKLHPAYRMCLAEMERKGRSYTVDTIKYLQSKYPGVHFSFIMGGDSLKNFHSWYKSEELQLLLPYIVIARPGFEVPKVDVPKQLLILDKVTLELSSSYIRESIQSGKENRFLLPVDVYQFIKEHRLYE